MKLTIEHEKMSITIDDPNAVTLDEFIEVYRAALIALTFDVKSVDEALGLDIDK